MLDELAVRRSLVDDRGAEEMRARVVGDLTSVRRQPGEFPCVEKEPAFRSKPRLLDLEPLPQCVSRRQAPAVGQRRDQAEELLERARSGRGRVDRCPQQVQPDDPADVREEVVERE